jgi:hypothetical protein
LSVDCAARVVKKKREIDCEMRADRATDIDSRVLQRAQRNQPKTDNARSARITFDTKFLRR